MASSHLPRHDPCQACGGRIGMASGLCQECAEAFALARLVHPTTAGRETQEVSDDLDLWDAWSLVGDAGG